MFMRDVISNFHLGGQCSDAEQLNKFSDIPHLFLVESTMSSCDAIG